jgi:hypothetical protein
MQTILCDRHPLQNMVRIVLSSRDLEPKQQVDGFQCPQCRRVYILAGDCGYLDFTEGRPIPDSRKQLLCPRHPNTPLYLAVFQFNGDESIRTWRCAHLGCKEVATTIGEHYLLHYC